MNLLMSTVLSFYQFNNPTLSQTLHTGPLIEPILTLFVSRDFCMFLKKKKKINSDLIGARPAASGY